MARRQEQGPRFAVIGTGRSGTAFMSRAATAAGYPCTHEGWWVHPRRRLRPYPERSGDSSWLGLPDIEAGTWTGPVVHVVRHPEQVIRSMTGIRLFNPVDGRHEPWRTFLFVNSPGLDAVNDRFGPVAAAARFWSDWNRRCAQVADVTVKLEDLPGVWGRVLRVIDQAMPSSLAAAQQMQAVARLPRNVNHRRRHTGDLGLDETHATALAADAAEYGYRMR